MRPATALGLLLLAPLLAIAEPVAPAEHRRGPEQTYLTYPEWFLVHSPAELAVFTRDHPPSEFPFFGHVGQFWSSYADVRAAIRDYPFNFGYHVMIVVIGVSTTVEYALKSVYETVVGRLTWLAATHGMTDEDRYAAVVAQDYVDFIRVLPWYEYDFTAKLHHLWADTPLWGPDALRKWERRYALTTEYTVKALYGWIIRKATKAAYDDPVPVTAVVVDALPPGNAAELPELKVLRTLPDGGALITVPRYEAFKVYSSALAAEGAQFQEIAGNRGVILVSALVPSGWTRAGQKVLFSQPILTRSGEQRVVLEVPVPELAAVLRELRAPGLQLEHVYDY